MGDEATDILANPVVAMAPGESGGSHAVALSSPAALVRPQSVVEVLVDFIAAVHGSPPPAESQTWEAADALAQVEALVGKGLVDPTRFDESYRPQSAEQLLALARSMFGHLSTRPAVAPVRIHGDFDLDTTLIDDGRIVGWRQVPVRVGDPYVDYALLARHVIAAFGPGAILAVFERLDVGEIDPIRLEFWVYVTQLRGAAAADTAADTATGDTDTNTGAAAADSATDG